MGLFDDLAGALGGGQSSNIIGTLLQGGAAPGGMSGVLEQLAANGLADHVASWTGDGQNLPVSPDQIRSALGNEQVQQMADASGLPVGDFLKHMADHLPAAASGQDAPSDQG